MTAATRPRLLGTRWTMILSSPPATMVAASHAHQRGCAARSYQPRIAAGRPSIVIGNDQASRAPGCRPAGGVSR